jgi:hypothetical protein
MLRDDLKHLVDAEIETTCQVSVLLAAGHTGPTIRDMLGISVAEYNMTRERIARVAHAWANENG